MCVVSAAMAVILFLDIVTSLNTSNTLIDIWSDVCFLMAGNAILLGNKQSQYRLQFTIKSRPFSSSMNSVHHPPLHPGEEVHDDVEGVIERGEEREEREVAAEDLVGRLAPEPLELGVDELQTGEEDGGDELLLALRVRSGGRPPSSARRRWGLRGRHAGATRARGGRTGRRPRR